MAAWGTFFRKCAKKMLSLQADTQGRLIAAFVACF